MYKFNDDSVCTDFIDFNAWDAEKTDIVLLLYKKILDHKGHKMVNAINPE